VERFIKGDVVVLPFPFSDLSEAKRRPALVLVPLVGDDLILCLITSQAKTDSYTIPLKSSGFEAGSLRKDSYIRINRLFTADNQIILYKAGHLNPEILGEVTSRLISLLQA
jgi:mRNA interferase MazF